MIIIQKYKYNDKHTIVRIKICDSDLYFDYNDLDNLVNELTEIRDIMKYKQLLNVDENNDKSLLK